MSPEGFVLVAGALTEVLVSFKPVAAGPKDIKVTDEVALLSIAHFFYGLLQACLTVFA